MSLFDLFSADSAKSAAQAQSDALLNGLSGANAAINQGSGSLISNYQAALPAYEAISATGQQGTSAYNDAMGLNGPAGSAAARAAFNNTPGYKFALNQGAQNVMRNQAATGQLASGATDLALQKQGIGLANQTYQDYVKNLLPYFNQANTGAAGQAGIDTGLGAAINANQNTIGGLTYGANASIGNAQANAENANSQASGNLWSTIMAGLGDVATIAGGRNGLLGSPNPSGNNLKF